jgi:methanogenic corrinoid protein MtbC1
MHRSPAIHGSPVAPAVANEYLLALHAGDATQSRRALQSALDAGATPDRLILEVVTPALRAIGDAWARGDLTVAHEHLATAIVLEDLVHLGPNLRDRGRRDRDEEPVAIVAATEDELHAVGARIVADFLEAAGWRVLYVGASTPREALVRLVMERRPQVVALSTTLSDHLPKAKATIEALRAIPDPPLIMAGGAAYHGVGHLALEFGADVYAAEADEAIARLQALAAG